MLAIQCATLGRSLVATLLVVLNLVGCGLTGAIDQTNFEIRNLTNSFDRAIDRISQESANWQVVLQELRQEVIDDTQSTIRVELDYLAQRAIMGTGVEFRCNTEFIRRLVVNELRRIRNDLVSSLGVLGVTVGELVDANDMPFVCNVAPTAVDLAIDESRRQQLDVFGFNFASQSIGASLLNQDGTREPLDSRLSRISDFHIVVDLTDIDFKATNTAISLRWAGSDRSWIPVLQLDTPSPQCSSKTETIMPGVISFYPAHIKGDNEFNGHGPCVEFSAKLLRQSVNPLGFSTRLVLRANMNAYECIGSDGSFGSISWSKWDPRSDFTTAKEERSFTLYTAPAWHRITFVDIDSNYQMPRFVDTDHSDDRVNPEPTEMFEELIFTGDTSGPDVGGTETGVQMRMRPIPIVVEDCSSVFGPTNE